MRVLMTAAATALSMGLFAAPAFADSNQSYGYRNGNAYGQTPQSQPYQPGYGNGSAYDDEDADYDNGYRGRGNRGYRGRDDDDRTYDRGEGQFQSWERGWGRDGGHGYHDRRGRVLGHWQLVRRIERQGYYDVRRLRPSRHGFGWRAFARYRIDGHRAMLRINPFTGRVIAARHL